MKGKKSAQTTYTVTDFLVANYIDFPETRFLVLGQPFLSFLYDGSVNQSRAFDASLLTWSDRNSATPLDPQQAEDMVLWMHRYTILCCDRASRTRVIQY